MASIRRHRDKWQAQIRRTGVASFSRTFTTKHEAECWARKTETSLDHQSAPNGVGAFRSYRLVDLLTRYGLEVSPNKRDHSIELYRLRSISRYPIAQFRMTNFNSSTVARSRDERLRTVSRDTVRRELGFSRNLQCDSVLGGNGIDECKVELGQWPLMST